MITICPASVRPAGRPSGRPSVNFSFKRHLLINHWANSNQTSQEHTLGEALPKLFKEFNSMQNSGCHGNQKANKSTIFKNLLLSKYKAYSPNIWYVASCRGPLTKLFKFYFWGQNWPRPRGHKFYIDLYREIFKKKHLLQNYYA